MYEEKMGLRQPNPTVETRGCVSMAQAWAFLLLFFLPLCLGRDMSDFWVSCQTLSAPRPRNSQLRALPPMNVCVCGFPVPTCADPVAVPLCISRNSSRTHLHPEPWLPCWQLLHILVPADAREPSPVSLVVLLRLRNGDWLQVSSCISGSKDASANAGLLLISGLQAEHEDDCYCVIAQQCFSQGHKQMQMWDEPSTCTESCSMTI